MGVDRRTVIQTIQSIEDNPGTKNNLSNLGSAGHLFREVAHYLGFNVLKITPTNARLPGIIAEVARLLAQRGISIRQAIVDDPELHPKPKLTFTVEGGKYLAKLFLKPSKIKGVIKFR